MKTTCWIWVSAAAACAAAWGCSSDAERAEPAPSPGVEPPAAGDETDGTDDPNEAEQSRPVRESAPRSEWLPCARKSCGDACTACDPSDGDCVETADRKSCSPKGECIAGTVRCAIPGAPTAGTETPAQPSTAPADRVGAVDTVRAAPVPAYQPCAGKTCGARCSSCQPDDTRCVETHKLESCSDDGVCSAAPVQCKNPWSATCAQLRELDEKARRLWGEQNGMSFDELEKVFAEHCAVGSSMALPTLE